MPSPASRPRAITISPACAPCSARRCAASLLERARVAVAPLVDGVHAGCRSRRGDARRAGNPGASAAGGRRRRMAGTAGAGRRARALPASARGGPSAIPSAAAKPPASRRRGARRPSPRKLARNDDAGRSSPSTIDCRRGTRALAPPPAADRRGRLAALTCACARAVVRVGVYAAARSARRPAGGGASGSVGGGGAAQWSFAPRRRGERRVASAARKGGVGDAGGRARDLRRRRRRRRWRDVSGGGDATEQRARHGSAPRPSARARMRPLFGDDGEPARRRGARCPTRDAAAAACAASLRRRSAPRGRRRCRSFEAAWCHDGSARRRRGGAQQRLHAARAVVDARSRLLRSSKPSWSVPLGTPSRGDGRLAAACAALRSRARRAIGRPSVQVGAERGRRHHAAKPPPPPKRGWRARPLRAAARVVVAAAASLAAQVQGLITARCALHADDHIRLCALGPRAAAAVPPAGPGSCATRAHRGAGSAAGTSTALGDGAGPRGRPACPTTGAICSTPRFQSTTFVQATIDQDLRPPPRRPHRRDRRAPTNPAPSKALGAASPSWRAPSRDRHGDHEGREVDGRWRRCRRHVGLPEEDQPRQEPGGREQVHAGGQSNRRRPSCSPSGASSRLRRLPRSPRARRSRRNTNASAGFSETHGQPRGRRRTARRSRRSCPRPLRHPPAAAARTGSRGVARRGVLVARRRRRAGDHRTSAASSQHDRGRRAVAATPRGDRRASCSFAGEPRAAASPSPPAAANASGSTRRARRAGARRSPAAATR